MGCAFHTNNCKRVVLVHEYWSVPMHFLLVDEYSRKHNKKVGEEEVEE
jgi:hypothetical protein